MLLTFEDAEGSIIIDWNAGDSVIPMGKNEGESMILENGLVTGWNDSGVNPDSCEVVALCFDGSIFDGPGRGVEL